MKEEAIIQPININKRGQQIFFQVKLPRGTHRIIGIETGLYVLNAPDYFVPVQELSKLVRRNNLMGVVQLQANTKPDIFYSKEIFERDNNIGADELKIIPFPVVKDRNSFNYFSQWTHGSKKEEDPLNVCSCTVINGQYKDAIGEYFQTDVNYKVILYIWIERKTNKQQ